jgi:glycosyltransferase involved in cell wall biosynthesis
MISEKTKILYIGLVPPEIGGKSAGGVATYTWELATQAHNSDYEVYILANTTISSKRNGIKIISLPQRSKFAKLFHGAKLYLVMKRKMSSLTFLTFREKIVLSYKAYLLKDILEDIQPHLIHVLHLLDTTLISLKLLQLITPLVATDHGMGVVSKFNLHKLYGSLDKNHLQKKVEEHIKIVDYIISVSNFAKTLLLEEFCSNINVKNIRAILNPLDTDKLPLLNREEVKEKLKLKEKKVIFFSGVSEPIKKKGLDILLKAISANNYYGLILGPQPWEKLIEYYNAADIFVLPSRTEGIGLVYEEALLAGVPVVGFPESVKELENLLGIYIGEIFDANKENEKNLNNKIIKVLKTGFDRGLLRKKVIDNLSWNVKFIEFEKVYRDLLNTG